MATFLAAPDEADYELDGAVLYTVGNPAPLTLVAPVLVAPENFTDYRRPQSAAQIVFG